MQNRNLIFDNLRAICMLGVIAIHAGSLVMTSGTPSEHIFMFFEVLSRYSVPTFFFISGYGLFLTYGTEKPLHYLHFLKKRLWTIGLPYILTSLLYMAYVDASYPDPHVWDMEAILFKLSFGTSMYHIYFLVILIWFYLLFPLWRLLMKAMEKLTLKLSLPLLALAQIWLYKASAHFWGYPQWIVSQDWLYNLCQYRLNYLPLFYLFVFMLGGVIARHYQSFLKLITQHRKIITLAFVISASCNAAIFYRYTYKWEMDWETTVNTLQQLSLPGLIYTVTAIFFFSMVLQKYQALSTTLCRPLAERSFLIYLIHPFFLDTLIYHLGYYGYPFNTVPMLPLYGAVVLVSYLAAEIIHYLLGKILPRKKRL